MWFYYYCLFDCLFVLFVCSFLSFYFPISSLPGKYRDPTDGPLHKLYQWFTTKARIAVTLRGGRRIRGTCQGQLIAFDKHWNLILKGAEERYRAREEVEVEEKKLVTNSEGMRGR